MPYDPNSEIKVSHNKAAVPQNQQFNTIPDYPTLFPLETDITGAGHKKSVEEQKQQHLDSKQHEQHETSTQISTTKHYSPNIIHLCENLYYRQSMIKDYLTCPQMMLYKWIVGHEEEDTFFAALLGTAGHSVIELMHSEKNIKNFDYSITDLEKLFIDYLDIAIQESKAPPRLAAKFPTIKAQANSVAPEYVEMLCGYSEDEIHQSFHSTVTEQQFVLKLTDEFDREFLSTGTIDQAGFYDDGRFALRDIKFRINNFKPGRIELILDIQLTLYAYALKHGNPTCQKCYPRYEDTINGPKLTYDGPCEDCEKKIGTAAWPNLLAERVELIWMRDYVKRKKDECAQYIISETEKEINPATGRQRKKRVINPKWITGYKIGDNTGKGVYTTYRSAAFMEVQIADIIRIAGMIRDGRFYRKPGEACNFWCKFKDICVNSLEVDMEEIDARIVNERIATADPFA
jgi:hypothetical protein